MPRLVLEAAGSSRRAYQPALRGSAGMPASAAQKAKRALVSIVLALAAAYNIVVNVSRDSSDSDVTQAYRKVSRRVHPDKGGSVADQQRLNAARASWEEARQQTSGRGRPRGAQNAPAAGGVARAGVPPELPGEPLAGDGKVYRVRTEAVLLTYQGFSLAQWPRLVSFLERNLKAWKVQRWCATLESNRRAE